MFIRVGGHLHHVRVDGRADRPAVIFVNSLGTDLRIWDAVVEPITDALRVVRSDMRGHGLTPATEPPYSIGALAADVERLMDALRIERATLCGVSVGGQVALQVAHDRPDQIDGLILCDTAYRLGTREMWGQRIAAVKDGGLASIADAVIARWFSAQYRAARPDDTAGYRYMLERCTPAGYSGVCAALRDADLEAIARRIRCRTLVLCGDEDQATPPELNRALSEVIVGARFEMIHGAGHLPCIEQPEIFSARVTAFTGYHAHAG